MLIWAIIPHIRASSMVNTCIIVRLISIFQYLLRLYLIFPLSSQIVKANGSVLEAAWAGAAYNLMLYMLASHVSLAITHFKTQESCARHSSRCRSWHTS